MKVLHIAQSDGVGGAARATYRMHRAMIEGGVDSTIWAGHKSMDDPTTVGSGARTRARLMSDVTAFLNYRLNRLGTPGLSDNFAATTLTYGDIARAPLAAAEVVCLHWIAGAFIDPRSLSRIGKPLVWQLWDMWPFTGGCHYSGACAGFENECGACPVIGSTRENDLSRRELDKKRRSYSEVDMTIVAPSRWLQQQAQRSTLFGRYPVELIPSGVDIRVFKPWDKAVARERLGLPRDGRIVLFGAASLSDRRKGFHLMPKIVEQIAGSPATADSTTLAIFGGTRFPASELSWGLPVHHLGRFSDDLALALAYSAADLLIAPYLEDNLPFVILEALACGTPVAAFAAGGIPDAVDHGVNGVLAEVGDTDRLGGDIAGVLSNAELLGSMQMNARRIAEERFDLAKCVDRFINLFGRLRD